MRTQLIPFLFFLRRAWSLSTVLTSRHVLERRESAPSGFVQVNAAPPDATFQLRVQLANSDIARLEDRLRLISSPSSAEYGNWLSREEVRSLIDL